MASAISSRRAHSKTIALTDGGLLHARVWNGRGAPLVLLHGLLDSAEGWTELCRTMRRPCVAIDLPGFGRSDLPARPPVLQLADDVVEALAELACDELFLIGHSLGGAVATAVAERLGGCVRGLFLPRPASDGSRSQRPSPFLVCEL